ncbi:MAG: hypothetical protein KDE48_18275 [Anaerolineales bacterium]|nr:hypothetical protein [Anaerolineales bacterium]
MSNNVEDMTKYQNDYYASYLLQIWFEQQLGGWQQFSTVTSIQCENQ